MKKRILITGGTGFVGSNLVKALFPSNEVLVIGNDVEQNLPDSIEIINTHFNGINWDKLKNIDVVFHQAANNDTQSLNKSEMDRANYWSAIELFNRLYENGCRRFVYASSTAVYGNSPVPYQEHTTPLDPLTPYAKSKADFDQFAMIFGRTKDCSVVGLRYCNIYGPGECHKGKRSSMIRQIALKMMNNESPKLFKMGEQSRDWVYVKDVVQLNLLAMSYNSYGIFNCASGTAYPFNIIVEIINQELMKNISINYIDNPIGGTFQNKTLCDISKAKFFLGYRPEYSLCEGIRDYLPYLNKKSQ